MPKSLLAQVKRPVFGGRTEAAPYGFRSINEAWLGSVEQPRLNSLMQIVCPNCATSYDVQASALGADGRSVRCARCRTVWHAKPQPEPEPAMAMAAAADDAVPTAAAAAAAAAAEPQGAEGDAASGEFDWSLGGDGDGKADVPEAAGAAASAAPSEDLGQGAVDDIFSATGDKVVDPAEAPSVVPAIDADAAPEAHAAPQPENIETVAARRAPKAKNKRKPKFPWPRPGLRAAIVMLAVILAGLIVGRAKVVQVAPQTASLYGALGLPVNLRGLVFENVRTTGEVHEGVPVLIVEGTIANVVNRTVEVPRLRFAMRNRTGQDIYAWTSVTGRSILAPGETAAFRTRLASPPADGRDVSVRFLTRRDLLAGMR